MSVLWANKCELDVFMDEPHERSTIPVGLFSQRYGMSKVWMAFQCAEDSLVNLAL